MRFYKLKVKEELFSKDFKGKYSVHGDNQLKFVDKENEVILFDSQIFQDRFKESEYESIELIDKLTYRTITKINPNFLYYIE